MKVLLVCSYLPYPLYSGGAVRLYNLMRELSKNHEITLACEKRDYQSEKDIQEVRKISKEVFIVNRKKQWSLKNIVKTSYSSYPFLLTGHTSNQMKNILSNLLKEEKFDVIHVETFYVFQNLPKTPIPKVLAEHNVEYKVYERYMQRSPILFRPFLKIDIEKIKFWERKFWNEADRLVAVSEEEKNEMKRNADIVPNGVNLESFPFKKSDYNKKEKTVLFMGDFKWIQNLNALKYILEKVWPILESRVNKYFRIKLWVVGKNIPLEFKSQKSSNVFFDENAPNKTSDIYKDSDILLSPIFVGGGTSYKILEAMASGVPVVTTSLGLEGLKGQDKKHALIAENENELANCVTSLLENKDLYDEIRNNARKLIEENYSWKIIAKKLDNVWRSTAEL